MNESNIQDVYTLQIRRNLSLKGGSPYCAGCKDGFLHVNSLQVRQFTESGKLPGVCTACNNAFLRICRLQIRHLTQTERPSHICTVCKKTFTHAGNYKKHQLLHQTEGEQISTQDYSCPKPPFHCPTCGRSFLKYGSFLRHCEGHDSESVFQCTICEKTFRNKSLLRNHLKSHNIPEFITNAQICKICKKRFGNPEVLAEHLLQHVQPSSSEAVIDNPIGDNDEEEEMGEEDAGDTREFGSGRHNHFCSVCQKGFVTLGHLKNHFSKHTGTLAVKCTVCNRRFMHPANLKKHMKVHVRKRLFKCKACGKVYKSRKCLENHVVIHEED